MRTRTVLALPFLAVGVIILLGVGAIAQIAEKIRIARMTPDELARYRGNYPYHNGPFA